MERIIEFILTYWIGILFSLIIGVISYLYNSLKLYRNISISTKNGVRILLKDELLKRYYDYRNRDEITIYEREFVDELYEEYIALGGNGIIKKMCDEIKEIPISNGGD